MTSRHLAELILCITEAEATFFIVVYGLFSRWRTTIVGRSMWWLAFSFWLLLSWILLSFAVPEFLRRDDVRSALFAFFAAMFFRMNWTLVRVQRAQRRGQPLEDLSDWTEP